MNRYNKRRIIFTINGNFFRNVKPTFSIFYFGQRRQQKLWNRLIHCSVQFSIVLYVYCRFLIVCASIAGSNLHDHTWRKTNILRKYSIFVVHSVRVFLFGLLLVGGSLLLTLITICRKISAIKIHWLNVLIFSIPWCWH